MRCEDVAREVRAVYTELDADIARFAHATGLQCRERCGTCCEKSLVEVTAVEMFPLAVTLWHREQAVPLLEKLELLGESQRCILYHPDADAAGHGRCAIYDLRPLLCRLFGFSTRLNKHGIPQLVTCRYIKEMGIAETAVQHAVGMGIAPPIMGHYSMRMYGIAPLLSRREPINVAFREALMTVGMQFSAGLLSRR